MTIRDTDRGAKALLKQLKKKPVVRVGVIGKEAADKHADSTVNTVADIATIHELGLGVPRRSFIADWADESEAEAKRRLLKAAARVAEPGDLNRELERFGVWAQGQIQQRISRGIGPELDPRTIERKGSTKQLIDTGQLRSSVTYEVSGG